jgi:hypothetical protein
VTPEVIPTPRKMFRWVVFNPFAVLKLTTAIPAGALSTKPAIFALSRGLKLAAAIALTTKKADTAAKLSIRKTFPEHVTFFTFISPSQKVVETICGYPKRQALRKT